MLHYSLYNCISKCFRHTSLTACSLKMGPIGCNIPEQNPWPKFLQVIFCYLIEQPIHLDIFFICWFRSLGTSFVLSEEADGVGVKWSEYTLMADVQTLLETFLKHVPEISLLQWSYFLVKTQNFWPWRLFSGARLSEFLNYKTLD
jgi:hypothetical protein